ncbi:hypothetical protein DPEC_G00167190 [Dallia pectoralis]|uniref:Uncharacterized protein n=1 Tax=Dallia pectoralis TaxID=75939 RepID=A0ACC2GI77_DALPE|nr:hypothetical protein DPEC_G00167190 [Dallia pectoralis]
MRAQHWPQQSGTVATIQIVYSVKAPRLRLPGEPRAVVSSPHQAWVDPTSWSLSLCRPLFPRLHQATSSSGNPIPPWSPQWITLDTCLNHISTESQIERMLPTLSHSA